MSRINIYNRDQGDLDHGKLAGWFESDTTTEHVQEDTKWDGNNHVGVMSGLQCGFEAIMRTKGGRWVRHYNSSREFNGPDYHDFITDDQAREWLLTAGEDETAAKWFGEIEEESGPPVGGRPKVGPPVSIAYPEQLLAHVDQAAKDAGTSRAAWLRQAAEQALNTRV